MGDPDGHRCKNCPALAAPITLQDIAFVGKAAAKGAWNTFVGLSNTVNEFINAGSNIVVGKDVIGYATPIPYDSTPEAVIGTVAPMAVAPELGEEELVGESANLASRAQEIHGTLDPIAQNMRTTAVGEVTDANGVTQTLVSSSEKALSPAQRAALQPGETAVAGEKGVHAEIKIMNQAEKNGQTVNAIAPSRNACPNCAAEAAKKKIPIINPDQSK